jgi:L-seryl-tRNA(Ser) seleniumtransferase
MNDPRRQLPSVSALLENGVVRVLLERAPRSLVTDAVRDVIDHARRDPTVLPESDAAWGERVRGALERLERPSLRAVFNATGVVLHTNLGRAPLAPAAIEAIAATAGGFTNLEYDLERGRRGSRYSHCVSLLRELTGAEDAIVVNNCAAALVLALNALCNGRDAVVSRGELIEIGGSFRVPEIMGKSGARLVEVGTTNRTHADDYRQALAAGAGAIVKVHRSNFTIDGFVAEATLAELAALAGEFGVPLLHDFGSGLLVRLDQFGLMGEPTASELVAEGATLVLMSGDKLLGGPQAGIIVGRGAAVAALRSDPLVRALRVDKLTLAALEATLSLYREPAMAVREIPALAMLTMPVADVRARCVRLCDALIAHGISAGIVDSEATVGGGAFPAARIPSAALAIEGDAGSMERRLRAAPRPVIGRIADGRLLLDLRSVPAAHDAGLTSAIVEGLR